MIHCYGSAVVTIRCLQPHHYIPSPVDQASERHFRSTTGYRPARVSPSATQALDSAAAWFMAGRVCVERRTPTTLQALITNNYHYDTLRSTSSNLARRITRPTDCCCVCSTKYYRKHDDGFMQQCRSHNGYIDKWHLVKRPVSSICAHVRGGGHSRWSTSSKLIDWARFNVPPNTL